jgi:hypothetical protein
MKGVVGDRNTFVTGGRVLDNPTPHLRMWFTGDSHPTQMVVHSQRLESPLQPNPQRERGWVAGYILTPATISFHLRRWSWGRVSATPRQILNVIIIICIISRGVNIITIINAPKITLSCTLHHSLNYYYSLRSIR